MKKIILIAILIIMVINTYSQEAIWGGGGIISPEIHQDNSVTFRFEVPNANEVKISGDWMPSKGWIHESVSMKKDTGNVWIYTTEALKSDLYSYYFIVDGLRCTDPNNVYLIRDVATVTNVFIVGNGKADNYSVKNVPHGSVTRTWYKSPKCKQVRRITIYTPPGYEQGKRKYPVLYLQHGMGGDEESWISLGRVSQIMDNLIAQGKAKPMIVAMSNGNIIQSAAPGESAKGLYKPSFQLPNTMDGKMEEAFVDVINFVEFNYRVKANKANRAIAGLSMGGFHSLHISYYYPNTFDYIGLFSPAIMPEDDVKSPVYDNFDESLKIQMKNGYKLYWIGIGKEDFLYKEVEKFRTKLDAIDMPYTFHESEGGHTWTNWRDYLCEFVPLLF